MRSSSAVQGVLRMSGFKWLCHLSRHCLPMRPGKLAVILDHLRGPDLRTCSQTMRSSSSVHCRFCPAPALLAALFETDFGDSSTEGHPQVAPHPVYMLCIVGGALL